MKRYFNQIPAVLLHSGWDRELELLPSEIQRLKLLGQTDTVPVFLTGSTVMRKKDNTRKVTGTGLLHRPLAGHTQHLP